MELLQKYQTIDPVIRQLKSGHKNKKKGSQPKLIPQSMGTKHSLDTSENTIKLL